MAINRIKIRTIIVLILVILLSFYTVLTAKAVKLREEQAFRNRYEIWQQANPEVEGKIKDYIDNVDWSVYLQEFSEALLNPALTVKDLYDYYGIK